MSEDRSPTPDRPDALAPLEYRSRERDEERTTRRPMPLWDRAKILLAILGAWGVLLWADMATNPILPLRDAVPYALRSRWWLLALAGLELIRQVHYLVSEHSVAYHRFWVQTVFGGLEGRVGRMNDWNRYRISRALKWLFWLAIADLILAKALHLPPAVAIFQIPVIIFQALPLILQVVFIMFLAIIQFVAIFWFLSRGGVDVYFPDDIKTRFSDVKGQDAVLERVKENIIFLEDPESIEEKGGYVPGGILLWGPPGTGKTLMAEAVAGETGRPFVFVEPGAFINMFFGVGVLKVKSLYRKLRKLAVRYGGVIVFFDEADSLGNRGALSGTGSWNFADSPWTTAPSCNGMAYLSRETAAYLLQSSLPATSVPDRPPRLVDRIVVAPGYGGGGMGVLQALLTEMSGLKKPRGFWNRVVRRALGLRPKPPPKYRILHIFATNMPQALDEAMLRPGRVDRIYKVGYPSKEGRKATYEYYLAKVKHELTPEQIDKLATITPYATGATIKDTVNEALVIAVRDGRDTITWPDVLKAKHLKEHGLPDDTEYIERERHAVAIHEACHAVVSYLLRKHAIIDMATIERRGDVGGFVSFIPPEDQFINWRSEMEIDIMGSLASLAGERMFFDGDNSAGVAGDLRNATAVATRMEAHLGMGRTLGSHYVTKYGIVFGRAPSAEDGTDRNLFETELGRRVEARLAELYERTWKLLEAHRREVLAVAHALETRKTISGDDVAAIIDGRPGTLLDGRPYRAPEFVEMLEAYHAEAVAAHRGHGRPTMALPVLVPARILGDGQGDGAAGAASGDGEAAGDGEARQGGGARPEPPAEVEAGAERERPGE